MSDGSGFSADPAALRDAARALADVLAPARDIAAQHDALLAAVSSALTSPAAHTSGPPYPETPVLPTPGAPASSDAVDLTSADERIAQILAESAQAMATVITLGERVLTALETAATGYAEAEQQAQDALPTTTHPQA